MVIGYHVRSEMLQVFDRLRQLRRKELVGVLNGEGRGLTVSFRRQGLLVHEEHTSSLTLSRRGRKFCLHRPGSPARK